MPIPPVETVLALDPATSIVYRLPVETAKEVGFTQIEERTFQPQLTAEELRQARITVLVERTFAAFDHPSRRDPLARY
jgi:hypothetical protein